MLFLDSPVQNLSKIKSEIGATLILKVIDGLLREREEPYYHSLY